MTVFFSTSSEPAGRANRDAFNKAVHDLDDLLRCELQAGISGEAALRKASVATQATIDRVAGVAVPLVDFEAFGIAKRAVNFHVGPPLDIGGKKPDNPYVSYGVGQIHAWDLALSVARTTGRAFYLQSNIAVPTLCCQVLGKRACGEVLHEVSNVLHNLFGVVLLVVVPVVHDVVSPCVLEINELSGGFGAELLAILFFRCVGTPIWLGELFLDVLDYVSPAFMAERHASVVRERSEPCSSTRIK